MIRDDHCIVELFSSFPICTLLLKEFNNHLAVIEWLIRVKERRHNLGKLHFYSPNLEGSALLKTRSAADR